MRKEKGFTLVELMFVVGIIGILAGLAIPAYMDYSTRAKVAEGFNLLDRAKTSVTETYVLSGGWKDDNDAYGLPLATEMSGTWVQSVSAEGNIITVTYNDVSRDVPAGRTVSMVGVPAAGSVKWTCSSDILLKYLPASCR